MSMRARDGEMLEKSTGKAFAIAELHVCMVCVALSMLHETFFYVDPISVKLTHSLHLIHMNNANPTIRIHMDSDGNGGSSSSTSSSNNNISRISLRSFVLVCIGVLMIRRRALNYIYAYVYKQLAYVYCMCNQIQRSTFESSAQL